VENDRVDEKGLVPALNKYVRDKRKTQLLIDLGDVDWGTTVAILDAAKEAGIDKAYWLVKKP
jgi:hypothetical protein